MRYLIHQELPHIPAENVWIVIRRSLAYLFFWCCRNQTSTPPYIIVGASTERSYIEKLGVWTLLQKFFLMFQWTITSENRKKKMLLFTSIYRDHHSNDTLAYHKLLVSEMKMNTQEPSKITATNKTKLQLQR